MYCCVGVAMFLITQPTNFSGRLAKLINNTNMTATAAVILLAIAKGLRQGRQLHKAEMMPAYTAMNADQLLPVAIMISGSMIAVSTLPQLNRELREDSRKKAAFLVPCLVALMHGSVFLGVGLAGYFALGAKAHGDVFEVYAQENSDWIVSILQWGMALLTFLSAPLVQLPAKMQVWNGICQYVNSDLPKDLCDAPLAVKLSLNTAIITATTAVPLLLGDESFMLFVAVCAGTACNWVSLFVPALCLIFADLMPSTQVVATTSTVPATPSRTRKRRKRVSAFASMWLLVVGCLFIRSSLSEMQELVKQMRGKFGHNRQLC